MSVTVFVFLVLCVFTLYQMAAIVLNVREIQRLREIKLRAKTQHSFGVLRHELMVLAAHGEIDSDSITFLDFYAFLTAVMRYPDHYKEIATLLRESFISEIHDSRERSIIEYLNREKSNWSPGVKKMVIGTGDAVNYLMISHSPLLRTLLSVFIVMRRLFMLFVKYELGLITKSIRMLANLDPTNRTFVRASDELRELAA